MKKIRIFLMSIICLILPGCSNNKLEYYANKKHKIDLKYFFNGDIEGWGAIFDYQGRQIRSFNVKIKASWNNNQGTLDEWFEFDDGEKTKRIWDITFTDDKIFKGKVHDIIGQAKGEQKGSAVNLHYTLQVPYNNSSIDLKMDDWMYLIEDDLILNRTSMKKFGFKVGEIILFMKKK